MWRNAKLRTPFFFLKWSKEYVIAHRIAVLTLPMKCISILSQSLFNKNNLTIYSYLSLAFMWYETGFQCVFFQVKSWLPQPHLLDASPSPTAVVALVIHWIFTYIP